MARPIRVLHVDDDVQFGDLTATFLEREDERFAVQTVTSATEGFDRIRDCPPDCVVSDYDMPGTNGVEFLQSIRQEWPRLPFILFTGKGTEEVASRAISAGVTEYLQKKGGADQFTVLANRIRNAVEHSASELKREQYRTVVETAGDAMYVLDEEGHIEIVNEAFERLSGYDRDELVGTPVGAFLSPAQVDQGTEAIRSLLRSDDRDSERFTFRARRPDGETRLYETTLSLVEQDGFAGSVGIIRDITDDRRKEELLSGLFEESLHGIGVMEIVTDDSGEPVDYIHRRVNERFEQLTGLDADEVVGRPATEVIDGLEETPFIEIYGEVALEGTTAEFEQYSAPLDRYYEVSAFSPQPGECICIFSDITERKEREHELRQFKTILETIEDGVYAVDAADRITYANEQYVQLKGADREELYGTTVDRWVAPDGVEEIREQAAELERAERDAARIEYHSRRADGSEFPAELRFTDIEFQDGSRGRVGVVRDITERKEREWDLRRKNEQLDKFASVISHDLRSPLNVATTRVELAREECDSPHLSHASAAHDRMRELIDDLLNLARQGEPIGEVEPVDLNELVHSCWSTVETEGATLESELETTVRADPGRLRQLLENLVRNAVEHGSTSLPSHTQEDAVEHGSTSPDSQARQDAVEHSSTSPPSHAQEDTVEHGSTSPQQAEDAGRAISSEPSVADAPEDAVEHGGSVTVTVGELEGGFWLEDDGPGIPEDERAEIFDPGRSLDGSGTGFGLAIVREIADAHGWELEVTDGDAGGARFEFTGVEFVDEPRSSS